MYELEDSRKKNGDLLSSIQTLQNKYKMLIFQNTIKLKAFHFE